MSKPDPDTCAAEIFPTWSNRWVRCGSKLRADGTCYRYWHPNPRPARTSPPTVDLGRC